MRSDEVSEDKIQLQTKLSYGLGTLGNDFSCSIINIFLMFYYLGFKPQVHRSLSLHCNLIYLRSELVANSQRVKALHHGRRVQGW
jgi:hypothetical protein